MTPRNSVLTFDVYGGSLVVLHEEAVAAIDGFLRRPDGWPADPPRYEYSLTADVHQRTGDGRVVSWSASVVATIHDAVLPDLPPPPSVGALRDER